MARLISHEFSTNPGRDCDFEIQSLGRASYAASGRGPEPALASYASAEGNTHSMIPTPACYNLHHGEIRKRASPFVASATTHRGAPGVRRAEAGDDGSVLNEKRKLVVDEDGKEYKRVSERVGTGVVGILDICLVRIPLLCISYVPNGNAGSVDGMVGGSWFNDGYHEDSMGRVSGW